MVLGCRMIAAQLDENNIVINRLVVDNLSVLPNLVDGTESVIGAAYDPQTQTFTPPSAVVIVPQSVSMAAGRVAMDRAGVLTAVDAAIAVIDGESTIWWDKADYIKRDFPLVEAVRVEMGWTHAYVDGLFISAQNIENGG